MSRLLLLPALLTAVVLGQSCSAKPAEDPSFLRVELPVYAGALVAPGAARVEVRAGTDVLTTLCVRLPTADAATQASFVLRRDFGKDPTKRVTLRVAGYAALSGADNVEPGKEFGCPPAGMLPPPLGDLQEVSVDFCEAKTRRLIVHLGAVCGCDDPSDAGPGDAGPGDAGPGDAAPDDDAGTMDDAGDDGDAGDAGDAGTTADGGDAVPTCGCGAGRVCGAGLSSAGHACYATECCAAEVSSACALEEVSATP